MSRSTRTPTTSAPSRWSKRAVPKGDASATGGSWRRLAWWQQTLLVYLLAHVFTTALAALAARGQVARPAHGEGPSPPLPFYLGHAWDGMWYEHIAQEGYPSALPLDDDGAVAQNPWAFYPLYPAIVRVVMTLSRMPWDYAAPATSFVLGAAASLVIYRLVESAVVLAGMDLPLRTVALVSVYPAALVVQAAYAEALALLLVALSLLLVQKQSYLWAVPTVLALGATRAVALPMAVVVLWHIACRWRAERSLPVESVPVVQVSRRPWLVPAGALLATAIVAGLAWPGVSALATGRPDAYFATQSAWRVGASTTIPFSSAVEYLEGKFGMVWPVAAVALVGFLGLAVLSRAGRRLGPEMQSWSAAYPVYLVAVAGVTSSGIRFALLAFPLLTVLAQWARRRTAFLALTVLFLAAQSLWTLEVWQWLPDTGLTP